MAAPRKGKMSEGGDTLVEGAPEKAEEQEAAEEESPEEEGSEPEFSDYENEEEYDLDNMDPKEEVWEGGPTFAQIKEWKQQYGEVYVTSVTPDVHFAWRPLTRFEYRRLIKTLEQALSTGQVTQAEANLDNEESIAELCILYPQYSRANSIGVMAGVASTIAQQVMEASAFVSMEVRQL